METIKKARALPVFRICDTDFYVDIRLGELRQVDAPWNGIPMNAIKASESEATEFAFDLHTKNIYQEHIDPDHIPEHVKLAIIPPLSALDPAGLARKVNQPDNNFNKIKTNRPLKHRKGYRL